MSYRKNSSNKIKWYWLVIGLLLLIAIGLRIYFLSVLGFHGDFGVFNVWAADLTKYGLLNFYQNSACNYLPLYVYLLKFSIAIQPLIHGVNSAWTNDQVVWISYKIPCFIFDILTAYVIYLFIFRQTKSKLLGALGTLVYLFNPVIFHNTYIYGQNNVLLYLPTVLLFYAISEKKHYLSGLSLAILLLIKPTGIVILPFVLTYFILLNKKDGLAYLKFVGSAYLILQLLILPFYFRLPWEYGKIFFNSLTAGNGYKVTQMYSYNLWYILTGSGSISDSTKYLGKSYYFWGTLMFAISYLVSVILLYIYKVKNYLILATIIYFCFFLFPTRVHEGYLLFAFPIFILAIFIYRSYILGLIYLITSLVYAYNIWGYWPWKLVNYLSIHYAGRYALLSAYILTLTPLVLLCYYVINRNKDIAKKK